MENNLSVLENKVNIFTDKMAYIKIENDSQNIVASNILKSIKELEKEIDSQEKEITKPINDSLKKIRLQFKPIKDKLYYFKNLISKKMIEYNMLETERKRIELERAKASELEQKKQALNNATNELEKASIKEDIVDIVCNEIEVPKTNIKTDKTTTFFKTLKKYRVFDLSIIPREFLCLDDGAVKTAINAGVEKIDGIEIYEEKIIVSR